jgi:hypothetical protein
MRRSVTRSSPSAGKGPEDRSPCRPRGRSQVGASTTSPADPDIRGTFRHPVWERRRPRPPAPTSPHLLSSGRVHAKCLCLGERGSGGTQGKALKKDKECGWNGIRAQRGQILDTPSTNRPSARRRPYGKSTVSCSLITNASRRSRKSTTASANASGRSAPISCPASYTKIKLQFGRISI